MVSPLPNSGQALTTVKNGMGFITTPWQRWLNQFTQAPATPASTPVGSSPSSFTATGDGTLFVSGGTVSAISLTRGIVSVPTGIVAGAIPVSAGDLVSITYSVAPTVNFVPA